MSALDFKLFQTLLRIAARFALLAYVAIARCLYVCAEQPRSSLMPRLPYFERIPEATRGMVEWASVNLSEAQTACVQQE